MNVTSHSETDQTVDLRISDADDNVHRVVIDRDGTVTDHWCDEFPGDESARSPRVRERFARVRRFGKYFLARRYGYEAVAPYSREDVIGDPDRITVVALLAATMSPSTVESWFGPCIDQLDAVHGDADPPVEPPATDPNAGVELIEQDVYLELSTDGIRRLADALVELEGIGALRQSLDACPNRDDADLFGRLEAAITPGLEPRGDVTSDRFVRATSPLRVHWATDGPTRVEYGDGPEPDVDGPPAARVQLTPAHGPPTSTAAFQRTLVDHLRCQLRDSYVGMGLVPPRDHQVLGLGIRACTDRYDRHDWLQNFHREEAVIDWTRLAPRPEL